MRRPETGDFILALPSPLECNGMSMSVRNSLKCKLKQKQIRT